MSTGTGAKPGARASAIPNARGKPDSAPRAFTLPPRPRRLLLAMQAVADAGGSVAGCVAAAAHTLRLAEQAATAASPVPATLPPGDDDAEGANLSRLHQSSFASHDVWGRFSVAEHRPYLAGSSSSSSSAAAASSSASSSLLLQPPPRSRGRDAAAPLVSVDSHASSSFAPISANTAAAADAAATVQPPSAMMRAVYAMFGPVIPYAPLPRSMTRMKNAAKGGRGAHTRDAVAATAADVGASSGERQRSAYGSFDEAATSGSAAAASLFGKPLVGSSFPSHAGGNHPRTMLDPLSERSVGEGDGSSSNAWSPAGSPKSMW